MRRASGEFATQRAACEKLGVAGHELRELKRLFSRYDSDGSGSIDACELSRLSHARNGRRVFKLLASLHAHAIT